MKRNNFYDVKCYIESQGYNLVSNDYKNNSMPLEMICPEGHICYISFGNFKDKNRRCSKCYGNKKLSQSDIQNILSEQGYVLLSNYINANEKIIVNCPNNHQWKTTWGKFQSGRRCPYCSGKFNNYSTIKNMIESEEGYKLITSNCKLLSDRLTVICRNNHEYETTGSNFKQGHRCPYCNTSKGENMVKYILEKYNIYYIEQYQFDDCKCKHKLSFDFFLPDNNCCIEYDGEFHYKPIMGDEEFKKGQMRDDIKNEYCFTNDIQLIRIPYWDYDIIESIIINELNIK